ncbi:MAG: ADP-ribosylglycohydrolase family protein [Hyphomicrobiales bacterium]
MTLERRGAACLLGALVGDAASLGLHWIYAVGRIADVVKEHGGFVAFTPIDEAHYAGVSSYFAHGARRDGMLSQYGESLRVMVQSMNETNRSFDTEAFQKKYCEVFGLGGTYQGYVDRPTLGTVNNIINEVTEPSGVDDTQLPAIVRLPALLAANGGAQNLEAETRDAVRVTNNNEFAVECGNVFAGLLRQVLRGDDVTDAIEAAANSATGEFGEGLRTAITTTQKDSVVFGEETGRACQLAQAMPLCFHILKHSSSYRDAIETNILAGGDSCGRAIVIGAVMAAKYGIATENGVPLSWVLSTADAAALWEEAKKLSGDTA